jgi:glucan phosphoethanolaminetransferase (alkaline phosphatase superfamily)
MTAEQAVRSAAQYGNSFSMVYFSDHGLAFKERGKEVQYLAHDDKFQQNFQVPFMVLSSDDKTHRIIKARRSANDFLSSSRSGRGLPRNRLKIVTRLSRVRRLPQCTLPTSSYRKLTIPIWVRISSI